MMLDAMLLALERSKASGVMTGSITHILRREPIHGLNKSWTQAYLCVKPKGSIVGSCRIWTDYLLIEDNISPIPVKELGMSQEEISDLLRGDIGYLYLLSNPSRFPRSLDIGSNTRDLSWTDAAWIRAIAASEGVVL